MTDLSPELRNMLDRQAILDCIHRYARGLDRHDDELVASAYHPDALDHHGDFTGRPDEFIPWANELHESEWVAHQHFITNHTVEIDGDVAHAESYVIGALRRKDVMVVDLAGGRYIDRLERRDGEWRIAAREVVIEWVFEGDGTQARFVIDTFPKGPGIATTCPTADRSRFSRPSRRSRAPRSASCASAEVDESQLVRTDDLEVLRLGEAASHRSTLSSHSSTMPSKSGCPARGHVGQDVVVHVLAVVAGELGDPCARGPCTSIQ